MRDGFIFSLLTLLCACSSASEEPSGPCKRASGNYNITYTQLTGDCGRISDVIVSVETGDTSTCTVRKSDWSPDMCHNDMDFTCGDSKDPALTADTVGSCDWNKDATSAACTISFVARKNGTIECRSTYRLDYRKL